MATPEQIKLIGNYEPVLFFHGGDATGPAERFFPSDAKRYLENCALWKANAPFATRADWGSAPVIEKGKIGALANEGAEFLGKGLPNGPFDYLETPANKECFLEMTGWKPAGTPFPPADRFANLDTLATRYATESPLNKSQFWYHAEFFDAVRLRGLFNALRVENEANPDFMQLLAAHPGKPAFLTAPALICYYLFYPGHDEGLAGCASVNEAKEFGSFAGEWTCLAVLLDRLSDSDPYAPKLIGLSKRNVGRIQFGGKEERVGMRIRPWGDMQLFEKTHPRLVVARGTHGFYLPGERPEPVLPLTEPDPSAGSCGLAAPLTETVITNPILHEAGEYIAIMLGKWAAGAAAGLALGPFAALGLLAGVIWSFLEAVDEVGEKTTVIPAPTLTPTTTDVVNVDGKVVHPKGLRPPEVDAGRAEEWRSKDNLIIDGRRYDSTVDRAIQILWPGEPQPDPVSSGDPNPNHKGYTGRWGPRVESDAETRRAGMRFPNFWLIFFNQLVRDNQPARVQILTKESGTTWTVPNDWNNTNNMIECIGGGGSGGGRTTAGGGGGGGGGAYARLNNLALTPGASVTYQVGAGGAALAGGGNSGTASYFNGTTVANASGGAAGGSAGGADGGVGVGGSASIGNGDVKFKGGDGSAATGSESGAGGGAAGPAGAGGDAASGDSLGGAANRTPGVAGGAPNTGGNDGSEFGSHGCGSGAGRRNVPDSNGDHGGFRGAAGSGCWNTSTVTRAGGAGRDGLIVITHTP